jgi:ankyrin repeat protein
MMSSSKSIASDDDGNELIKAVMVEFRAVLNGLSLKPHTLLNAKTKTGMTALMIAAEKGNVDIARMIISSVQDALMTINPPGDTFYINDRQANTGYTAVHYAAMGGHADMLRLFSDTSILARLAGRVITFDIASRDNSGLTPLDQAVARGKANAVRLLGMEIERRNRQRVMGGEEDAVPV